MRITCAQCGGVVLAARYCDRCGAKVNNTCRSCGAENRPDARFCADCGTAFEPNDTASALTDTDAAQQKQVTVLFADICGSTHLISEMDPEEARDTLIPVIGVICEAMTRHGGVVNRKMGDGVMVLFGAPNAAEDHAARACFAILAALEDVRRMGDTGLSIRAGICSGPIILYRTGRDDEDYDVAGVTAHVAARLEQQAEPDTVLIAQPTARLVRGVARLEPVGELPLKGLAEPQPVFRLLGAVDRPSWYRRAGTRALSPYVGRDRELAQLAHALDRVSAGRPQALALVADAGMGKSRLVHEFLGRCVPDDWLVVRVETTEQTQAIPYFLVTALLRHLLGCLPEDTPAERAARLSAGVVSLGLDAAFDTSPLLVHLDTDTGAARDTFDPAQRRLRLLRAIHPILVRFADLHPFLLIIEDYQWLDRSSVELLTDLLGHPDPIRFFLLLTTRPERRPGWPRQTAGPRLEIELDRLGPEQAESLLKELLGGADTFAALRETIVARADGTPFFLEEFAHSLRESGVLADGAEPPRDIVIPASVQAILAARIDRQIPLHRRILQIAAVIGRDVSLSLLESVADVDAGLLATAVRTLRDARFLFQKTTPGDPQGNSIYGFSHALTHAVAYDTLLRSERRKLHERVLRLLEAQSADDPLNAVDQLTHHAVSAEAWPEAARYALAAGNRASRRGALTEAKAYLESAIAALDRQPVSVATLTMGIDARLALRGVGMNAGLGRQESLQQYLVEADHLAELAGDRRSMARVTISRGAILSHWGDLPGAIAVSQTALTLMTALGETIGIVSAAFSLAQAHWYAGNLREARDLLIAHLPYARHDAGQRRGTATFVLPAAAFFCYLARVHGELGDLDAASAALREARAAARTHGQTFDEILVDINQGWLHATAGDPAASINILERSLEVTRTNSLEWHLPMIAAALGRAYLDVGRAGDALPLLRAGADVGDRSRHIGKWLQCNPALIRALAEAPTSAIWPARELASETLRQATSHGFRPIVVQTHIALGRVLILGGDHDEARHELRRGLELATEIGMVHQACEAEVLLAERITARVASM